VPGGGGCPRRDGVAGAQGEEVVQGGGVAVRVGHVRHRPGRRHPPAHRTKLGRDGSPSRSPTLWGSAGWDRMMGITFPPPPSSMRGDGGAGGSGRICPQSRGLGPASWLRERQRAGTAGGSYRTSARSTASHAAGGRACGEGGGDKALWWQRRGGAVVDAVVHRVGKGTDSHLLGVHSRPWVRRPRRPQWGTAEGQRAGRIGPGGPLGASPQRWGATRTASSAPPSRLQRCSGMGGNPTAQTVSGVHPPPGVFGA